MSALSRDEITRYSRNILLPEVRRAGQERLKDSSVLVVGAGGTGSPVLLYLAAAGAGRIRCVDSDQLDLTNLQRQVLYSQSDVGASKTDLARKRLADLNPHIELEFLEERFKPENAQRLMEGADLVIETADNFETKFAVNDAAIAAGLPFITGGILRFDGQILCVHPGHSSCYRCLFENPPPPGDVPSCSGAGVLGAVAGVVGSVMAGEALKILLGLPAAFGVLQQYNLLSSRWRTLALPRRPGCICSPTTAARSPSQNPPG
jgi:molybdopterin/thiamine biosynthesis adenylyltransferase